MIGMDASAQSVYESVYTVSVYNGSAWYRGVANAEGGFDMVARPLDPDSADIYDTTLICTDSAGNEVMSVQYNIPGSDAPADLMTANGAAYLSSATSSTLSRTILMRLNGDRSVDWSMDLQAIDSAGFEPYALAEAADGSILLANALHYDGVTAYPVIVKVDVDGSLVWARKLSPDSGFVQVLSVLGLPDGKIALAGRYFDGQGFSMLLVLLDPNGGFIRAMRYGNGISDPYNDVVIDPIHGLALVGSMDENDGAPRGCVIRVDTMGIVHDAFKVGINVEGAYAFADSSILLFTQSANYSNAHRISHDHVIMWSSEMDDFTGSGELLPHAEASHFAFFAGDFSENLKVSTFTSQCVSCGTPGNLNEYLTDYTPSTSPLILNSEPLPILAVPINVTASEVTATRMPNCTYTGQVELVEPVVGCSWNNSSRSISITGLDREGSLEVRDAMGRLVGETWTMVESDDHWSAALLEPLSSGLYVAVVLRDGRRMNCPFVVSR